MPVLVLSEGGMDVSRDPFGELQGAIGILTRRALEANGVELGDGGFELGFWSRFPHGQKVRGNDKRLAQTIQDLSASRDDIDAIVVVIDADGDGPARLKKLQKGRSEAENRGDNLAQKTSVGVAIEMVEAWLIGDHNAIVGVLKRSEGGKDPEGHSDPKSVLAEWIAESDLEVIMAYSELANTCSLDIVAERCASFRKFLADIKGHLP